MPLPGPGFIFSSPVGSVAASPFHMPYPIGCFRRSVRISLGSKNVFWGRTNRYLMGGGGGGGVG